MDRKEYAELEGHHIQEDNRKDDSYRCQFCGYYGKSWQGGGYVCPECGNHYDWMAAQDSEE